MSKHNDWKKTKTIYWHDELNDDFDELGLIRPSVPKDYHYKRTNPINNFFSGILYYVIAVPILGIYCYLHGIRIKNKKYIKQCKKTGGIIYANHVAISDVFKYQVMASPTRRINILGYSDTLSLPIVRNITRALGYLPIPLRDDLNNFIAMNKAITWYINEKHQFLLVYPEAHIWPYYTHIRHFKDGSFRYAAQANCPVIPAVTVWRKPLLGKKPKQTIIIGEPIYPLENKDLTSNKIYLHDKCYEAMKTICNSYNQPEYIKYIKVD